MFLNCTFSYKNCTYSTNFSKPIDVSLPLHAGKETVNCYYAENISYETIQVGDFVGDVKVGGSCNYQRIHFTPHGNGTHTECYGHLVDTPATINTSLKEFMFFALVISVPCTKMANGDELILLSSLKEQVGTTQPEALLIRTLPNTILKKQQHYSGTNPPYLEPSIGTYLREIGVKHLLVDLPSVDKEWDNGVLATHRNFWNLPARDEKVNLDTVRTTCTITELIFVPSEIEDGLYLLNLQLASFETDASPSKPILYALEAIS